MLTTIIEDIACVIVDDDSDPIYYYQHDLCGVRIDQAVFSGIYIYIYICVCVCVCVVVGGVGIFVILWKHTIITPSFSDFFSCVRVYVLP